MDRETPHLLFVIATCWPPYRPSLFDDLLLLFLNLNSRLETMDTKSLRYFPRISGVVREVNLKINLKLWNINLKS